VWLNVVKHGDTMAKCGDGNFYNHHGQFVKDGTAMAFCDM